MGKLRDFTPEETEEFRKVWNRMGIAKMAAHFRTSYRCLDRLARQLGLPPRHVHRKRPRSSSNPPLSKPTPTRRPCLCCGEPFGSEGAHNRLCNVCRKKDGGMEAGISGVVRMNGRGHVVMVNQ